MNRRSFLITLGGLLLGARNLPAAPVQGFKRQTPYLIMPSYFEPHSATGWLELRDGLWQPMMFEAEGDCDRQAVGNYERSLQRPGLNYEQVARTPAQPGQWTVRLRQSARLYYLTTAREAELVPESAVEFSDDPQEAPVLSHADAVRLAVFMLRQAEEPDIFSFYEPVRLDKALPDYDEDATPLLVDYLPTGYQRSVAK
jgi:hypothetical protein